MKKIIIATLMMMGCASVDAQMVFSKFKFTKDSPFGAFPTRKGLDVKFKNTSDKVIKKFSIHYSGVDQINEAVCSDIVGAVNANVKHTKYRILSFTGPFAVGKSQSSWTSAVFYYQLKVTAFPRKLDIVYMDNSEESIEITKDNIKTFFPCLEWIDVDYKHGFQPSN